MYRTIRRTLCLIILLCIAGGTGQMQAQSTFRLKRTKKESVPINVQLLVGYNGMSDPAEIIQDIYEHSNLTILGGVAVGLQGMIAVDSILTTLWIGLEISYARMAQRWLLDDPNVHYIGEPDSRVDAVERLWGMGGNLLFAIGPISRVTLIFGPGMQYQDARVDKDLPMEGTLYEDRIIATALGSVNLQLLVYDHGSIDANFRGLWGFGEYGSFQFQSMLGFTFNF